MPRKHPVSKVRSFQKAMDRSAARDLERARRANKRMLDASKRSR